VTQPESHQFGGVLREFAGDWTPIFADIEREYAHLTEVTFCSANESGISLEVRATDGATVRGTIAFVTAHVFRLRLWLEAEPPGDSPMLVADAHRTYRAQFSESDDRIEVSSGAIDVLVNKLEWSIAVRPRDQRAIFEQRWDDRQIIGAITLPTGYSRRADGSVQFHEVFSLEPDEHLYGLGEQFGAFDRKGQRIVSWSRDPVGAATSTVCYINIPLLISSRGFGLFLHHHSKLTYELGNPALQTAAARVGDSYLDYFFIYGPSPKEIISRYTELTGRATVPPLWSFGVWWSRCMYRNREQVEGIVERLRELDIPGDVVHLDPLWLKGRKDKRLDGCHFEWDEEAFPDPQGFVDWLAERGFKLSLWEIPYVYDDSEMAREGEANGYFARDPASGPAKPLDNPEETVLADFTNPEAVRWWQDKHRPYLKMGVGAFKPDYGEAVPVDAIFSDGRTGEQVHNLYPLLYNKAVYEVMLEERGEAMLFSRSGYAGSQRYPINWTGDAPCTWGGMAAALRAGLSLSMSGISMWSHDIGGFWNPRLFQPPDPTLYIRWAQFGLLSSHSRFHGVRGREPWYFGQKAIEVVRAFAKLRRRLLPYIYSLAEEAAETGVPVVRPLVLECPDDPVAATIDYEYMLGPHLLVVPVMNPEGRALVYLPEGEWRDWWTDEVTTGPRHVRLDVPIDRCPLYARAGVEIPMATK
jgi:alpha-D-xyloside xylohydrolase